MKLYPLFLASLAITSFPLAAKVFIPDFEDYHQEDCSNKTEFSATYSPSIDFDTMQQSFILETKKINIPGHPFAFNPSIVKWNGSLLMSFRTYDPKTHSTNPFGLIWLNEDLEPIGSPQLFELPFKNSKLVSKQQDPRLIILAGRLFAVYNNILENVTDYEMRRMFVVEIQYDGKQFTASTPECLEHFEGENKARYEKNWVPFSYRDELFLSYSLIPHRIFSPQWGTGSCKTAFVTETENPWRWGAVRGGTQAILDNDHYIGFFHSWIDIPSAQSGGKKISHYLMGAYTFDKEPPFALRSISKEPIVANNFYYPPYYKTWKPLRCVFPTGLVVEENHLLVSYGRQDHECWILKLDKKELLKSLLPVVNKQ